MLNGGAVNVGNIQVAGVSGARKTAELTIAGSGSRVTSGSSVNVGDYGNGVLAVMDGGTFSAGGNEVVLGKTGSGSNRGALIIGSRGNMDTVTGLTEPTLGAAAPQALSMPRRRSPAGGLFGSYVYFNHTDGNYVFSNKMSGEGEVINTAGHTTLNGDPLGCRPTLPRVAVSSSSPAISIPRKKTISSRSKPSAPKTAAR